MSTLRLLRLANQYIPQSSAVAAGLNIASFNFGTALGGVSGGLMITYAGLAYVPIGGINCHWHTLVSNELALRLNTLLPRVL
jgi:predicted MFS family arabinose efflux permease